MAQRLYCRKRALIDARVQGALIVRVIVYWMVCLTTVWLMLFGWQILSGPEMSVLDHARQIWYQFGPAVLASLLMLPLVILDIIRLSHRFTGPMFRMRRLMKALGRGERVDVLRFRRRDYWQDFSDNFNAVVARMERLAERNRAMLLSSSQRAPAKDDELEADIKALANSR